MSILVYDEIWVREPRLMVPGQKPLSNVVIDTTDVQSRALVSAWPLTENGALPRDRGKFACHMTSSSGVEWRSYSQFGPAPYQTSTTGSMKGGDNFPLSGSEISMSLWYYLVYDGYSILSKSKDDNSGAWDWGILRYQNNLYPIRNGVNPIGVSSASLTVSAWSHIVVRISETYHSIHVNRVKIKEGAGVGSGNTANTSTRTVNLLGYGTNTPRAATADVRVYNSIINDAMIDELYFRPYGCYVPA